MTTPPRTPSAVWRCTPQLLLALQDRLGDPLDTYVNGSQVWLREDGPGDVTLEWRLHPVAAYERPAGTSTESVFARTTFALANQDEPPAPLDALWGGLEVFPAFADPIEVDDLVRIATEVLGIGPDVSGLADHRAVGDAWERGRGKADIVQLLLAQLS